MNFILGKKISMSQIFRNDKVVPITLIEAGPCFVTQVKGKEKDKYEAIQLGFENLAKRKIKKPMVAKPYRHIREFRNMEHETWNMKQGDKIDVSIFKEGDKIKVSAISKGKGFQGAVKRWGFHGRNATHGMKHEERAIGSVGQTDPERVFPGKKMPGRMGAERVSVRNLEIVKVDLENNIMAVKGAIPGRRGSLVEIRSL